jgi:hypothetical protein
MLFFVVSLFCCFGRRIATPAPAAAVACSRPETARRTSTRTAERFQRDQAELFEEPTIAEMEEAIANEQAAAQDGDASDDGSFEFEPMDELELAEADDANDPAANARNAQNARNARNAGTAVSTKRKRAAQTATPKAARKASRGPTSK